MFTKEAAQGVKHILDTNSEKEIILLLQDLIDKEHRTLRYNTPEVEKVASLARIDILQRLKNYRNELKAHYGN